MKKSSFTALVLGTVGAILFSLGMCMALLPEWSSFKEGVILGSAGLILGVITLLIWRRMENKPPIKFSGKGALSILVGIIGALLLGVGMCFAMVWENFIIGIIIGIVGIIALLSLIPLINGFKD